MKKTVILALFFFLCSCSSVEVGDYVIPPTKEEYVVKMVAVGDNLIHDSIYQAAYVNSTYDFKPFYENIKDYIQSFDLAFINQETILGGTELGLSSYPAFNSPKELAYDLVETGFNLMSIANNHTLDRGQQAIVNATKTLDELNVIYSGARRDEGSQVRLFEKSGISFAFVAYTYGTNGIKIPPGKEYLVHLYSEKQAISDLKGLKDQVDFVLVSIHWGHEYTLYPNAYQLEAAAVFNRLGVDVVLGHHPHVVQPVDEWKQYRDKTFVAYSLGNFLSDQKGLDRLVGAALEIEFYKSVEKKKVTTKYRNPAIRLLYRYKQVGHFSVMPLASVGDELLTGYGRLFLEKEQLVKTYVAEIVVK